ncbi:MAG: sigma-70 family RNA polymerase sigma factor [Calditrichaeota bacterium]|nr:sigma-70 family RNA polymerase sigma factor [Calditrichota bacterium]
MKDFENALNTHLDEILSFAHSKLNDQQLAADVVQDSLLKAVKAQDQLKEEANIRAWLFSILRNTITDLYRKQAKNKLTIEDPGNLPNADEIDQLACTCMEKLIPTMNEDYAWLIKELELNQKQTSLIAKKLNISENNLKVKRHRARQQLKQRLEETCQMCAKHGCLDCDCEQT